LPPVQQALKKLLLADQRVQVMSNIIRMKCFCINSTAHLTMTIVVITDSTAEPPIQPTTRTLHIIEYKLALWKNGAGLWPFKVVLVDAPANHTTTFVCDSSNALYYLNKKSRCGSVHKAHYHVFQGKGAGGKAYKDPCSW
jgi:hypothetical protein